MNSKSFFPVSISTLICLSGCITSVQAQSNSGRPNNLSDVAGPFLGNTTVHVPFGTGMVPRAISVWVPLPDLVTQSIITPTGASAGQNTSVGAVLVDSAIDFNQSMDKLLPFCGCANPRWRSYNHTVKSAGRLRVALINAVTEQRQILVANPTPEQVDAAHKRLKALEETTLALEKATDVLSALSNALSKAR